MNSPGRPPLKVDLRLHSTRELLPDGDRKGRPLWVRVIWVFVNAAVLRNPIAPGYRFKAAVLRAFGASIGQGVVIKPSINVSRPWNLTIGDYSWIGEGVWLDSSAALKIGRHVVVSQGAYLCSGTHDWRDPGMGSVIAPITIEDGVWIAACARVAGGVTIGQETVVALGGVIFTDCKPRSTYRGNPAERVGERRIRDYPGPPRKVRPRVIAPDK